jgi:Acyl-CoA carboxylase epsilon subunit
MTSQKAADSEQPVLHVVHGSPSAEELAALTAVVTALPEPAAAPRRPPPRGRWNDPAFRLRRFWAVGPDGWRSAR